MSQSERRELIDMISAFPNQIKLMVGVLAKDQLTYRYIESEWTVAQNVHHLADAHMNAYIRTKLILSEDYPTLKPYHQEVWAEFFDATDKDVKISLDLIDALHQRWVKLFESLDPDDFLRTGYHPELDADISVDDLLFTYAHHGQGHIVQVNETLAAGD